MSIALCKEGVMAANFLISCSSTKVCKQHNLLTIGHRINWWASWLSTSPWQDTYNKITTMWFLKIILITVISQTRKPWASVIRSPVKVTVLVMACKCPDLALLVPVTTWIQVANSTRWVMAGIRKPRCMVMVRWELMVKIMTGDSLWTLPKLLITANQIEQQQIHLTQLHQVFNKPNQLLRAHFSPIKAINKIRGIRAEYSPILGKISSTNSSSQVTDNLKGP